MLSSSELSNSTALFDIGKNRFLSHSTLKGRLPDVETALFFAKVYDLNYAQLSDLLRLLFKTSVMSVLSEGGHSTELQGYLVSTVPPEVWPEEEPEFVEAPPPAEILPELWASLEIEVATSIKQVADKLATTLDLLPGKQGQMVFSHMARLNKQRPTVGVYGAQIHHPRVERNLVILDVSGSVSSGTVAAIINDVVGLSWKANAYLAIVSNNTFLWEPGSYNVADVLAKAEYAGTHYETLTPIFDQDWGTVVTIADYDSSWSAKEWLKTHAKGRVGQVLDISLVDRVSFLAECVGQLADEVRPLLVGASYRALRY